MLAGVVMVASASAGRLPSLWAAAARASVLFPAAVQLGVTSDPRRAQPGSNGCSTGRACPQAGQATRGGRGLFVAAAGRTPDGGAFADEPPRLQGSMRPCLVRPGAWSRRVRWRLESVRETLPSLS